MVIDSPLLRKMKNKLAETILLQGNYSCNLPNNGLFFNRLIWLWSIIDTIRWVFIMFSERMHHIGGWNKWQMNSHYRRNDLFYKLLLIDGGISLEKLTDTKGLCSSVRSDVLQYESVQEQAMFVLYSTYQRHWYTRTCT